MRVGTAQDERGRDDEGTAEADTASCLTAGEAFALLVAASITALRFCASSASARICCAVVSAMMASASKLVCAEKKSKSNEPRI